MRWTISCYSSPLSKLIPFSFIANSLCRKRKLKPTSVRPLCMLKYCLRFAGLHGHLRGLRPIVGGGRPLQSLDDGWRHLLGDQQTNVRITMRLMSLARTVHYVRYNSISRKLIKLRQDTYLLLFFAEGFKEKKLICWFSFDKISPSLLFALIEISCHTTQLLTWKSGNGRKDIHFHICIFPFHILECKFSDIWYLWLLFDKYKGELIRFLLFSPEVATKKRLERWAISLEDTVTDPLGVQVCHPMFEQNACM